MRVYLMRFSGRCCSFEDNNDGKVYNIEWAELLWLDETPIWMKHLSKNLN